MLFRSSALSTSLSVAATSMITEPPSLTLATSLPATGASLVPMMVILMSCVVPSALDTVMISVSVWPVVNAWIAAWLVLAA